MPSKIKKVVGDFLKEKHGIIVKETHGSPSSSEVETCQWYVVSFSVQSGAKSVHVDICTESSEKPKACIELVCESMKTGGGNKRSRNKNVVSSFPSDLSVESLPSKKVKLDDGIKLSLVREAGAGNVISINVVRVLDLNQENYINGADDPQVIQAGEQPLAESDYGGPSKAVDDQG